MWAAGREGVWELAIDGKKLTVSETPLGLCAQLQQVRHAASSLERVAGAMARQAAADHPGRDDGVRFTVGPVDGRASRDNQGDSRRRSL